MRIRVAGDKLSTRQSQVVELLADGHGAKEIAYRLGLSIRTVDNHILAARQATTARNSVALVAMALREGWIS